MITRGIPSSKWRRHMHMQQLLKEHQDHWRLCTAFHVEVKLWYTKNTSITQHHCSSKSTPPIGWTYQLSRVESCHESSRPHHYCGPYCCNQCNVTWKSKRPTCCTKSHVKLKIHGSQIVMRVVEQPQGSFSPLAINTRSFVHVKVLACGGLTQVQC